MQPTGIAIVGCGYIADSYRFCAQYYSATLRLVGVFDRDPQRLSAHVKYWGGQAFSSIEQAFKDPAVRVVVNLTDPESHADVTRAAIAAGKHVYSEKPLAMTATEAAALRETARAAGVKMASAPCNVLGESAQTAWSAVRAGKVGKVRLVYAELDDGMIHRMNYQNWINRSGRAWPARGEFATGCTFEHAGYVLTVLGAMFGPVRRVTAFSSLLIADKKAKPPLPNPAPDFSVGLLEFDDGVVARLTNSIVAPYNHRLRLIGEEGQIEVRETWDYASAVTWRPVAQGRLSRYLERQFGTSRSMRLPLVRRPLFKGGRGRPTMDFMRGVNELAQSVRENRPSRLDEDLAVHVTEITEMLQHPDRFERPANVQSTFAPIKPMDWAL